MQQDREAKLSASAETSSTVADPDAEPSLFGADEAIGSAGERAADACGPAASGIDEPDNAGEFDWDERDAEAVVVKRQAAIAVYPNPRGHIVIRRERGWDEDDDTFVYVQPENAEAVAKALLAAAAEIRSWAQPGSRGTKSG